MSMQAIEKAPATPSDERVRGIRKLLTIGEVAEVLGVTARTVRALPIPFVRISRLRKYDPRDVEVYIGASKKCPSSKDPVRRTSTRSSKSMGIGFLESTKATTRREAERVEKQLKEQERARLKEKQVATFTLDKAFGQYWTEQSRHLSPTWASEVERYCKEILRLTPPNLTIATWMTQT